MQLETIVRGEGIDEKRFLAEYFNKGIPVVINNFIDKRSSALTHWDYNFLKEKVGHLSVNLYGREDEFNDFVKTHPDSQLTPEAQAQMARLKDKEAQNNFVIAEFYKKQKNLKAARIYYKEVINNYADTSWGPKAQAILKIIGE